MASSKAIFLISLNLVFFTLVSSSYVPTTPSPPPPPPPPSYDGPSGQGRSPTPVPTTGGKCPKNTLQIAACASVLHGLVHANLEPARPHCCSLVDGLVGLDAAVCLCTALEVRVLGLAHLRLPISVTLLLNLCNKAGVPADYKCPNY